VARRNTASLAAAKLAASSAPSRRTSSPTSTLPSMTFALEYRNLWPVVEHHPWRLHLLCRGKVHEHLEAMRALPHLPGKLVMRDAAARNGPDDCARLGHELMTEAVAVDELAFAVLE